MASFLRKKLAAKLGAFFKNADPKNINLKFFKGEGALSNLELDETVFEDLLQLPPNMALVKGFVNEVRARVPWTNLKKEPVTIICDTITIEITEVRGAYVQTRLARRRDAAIQQAVNGQKGATQSYGYLDKVVDGVRIQINALSIHVQTLPADPLEPACPPAPSLTISLANVLIVSTAPNWKAADLRKTRVQLPSGDILLFKVLHCECLSVSVVAGGGSGGSGDGSNRSGDGDEEADGEGTESEVSRLDWTFAPVYFHITRKRRLATVGPAPLRLAVFLDDPKLTIHHRDLLLFKSLGEALSAFNRRAAAYKGTEASNGGGSGGSGGPSTPPQLRRVDSQTSFASSPGSEWDDGASQLSSNESASVRAGGQGAAAVDPSSLDVLWTEFSVAVNTMRLVLYDDWDGHDAHFAFAHLDQLRIHVVPDHSPDSAEVAETEVRIMLHQLILQQSNPNETKDGAYTTLLRGSDTTGGLVMGESEPFVSIHLVNRARKGGGAGNGNGGGGPGPGRRRKRYEDDAVAGGAAVQSEARVRVCYPEIVFDRDEFYRLVAFVGDEHAPPGPLPKDMVVDNLAPGELPRLVRVDLLEPVIVAPPYAGHPGREYVAAQVMRLRFSSLSILSEPMRPVSPVFGDGLFAKPRRAFPNRPGDMDQANGRVRDIFQIFAPSLEIELAPGPADDSVVVMRMAPLQVDVTRLVGAVGFSPSMEACVKIGRMTGSLARPHVVYLAQAAEYKLGWAPPTLQEWVARRDAAQAPNDTASASGGDRPTSPRAGDSQSSEPIPAAPAEETAKPLPALPTTGSAAPAFPGSGSDDAGSSDLGPAAERHNALPPQDPELVPRPAEEGGAWAEANRSGDAVPDWAFFSPEEYRELDLEFTDVSEGAEFVGGKEIRPHFKSFGVATKVLRDIWILSDVTHDGQLSREEFIAARVLINAKVADPDLELPARLPRHLHPDCLEGWAMGRATTPQSLSWAAGAGPEVDGSERDTGESVASTEDGEDVGNDEPPERAGGGNEGGVAAEEAPGAGDEVAPPKLLPRREVFNRTKVVIDDFELDLLAPPAEVADLVDPWPHEVRASVEADGGLLKIASFAISDMRVLQEQHASANVNKIEIHSLGMTGLDSAPLGGEFVDDGSGDVDRSHMGRTPSADHSPEIYIRQETDIGEWTSQRVDVVTKAMHVALVDVLQGAIQRTVAPDNPPGVAIRPGATMRVTMYDFRFSQLKVPDDPEGRAAFEAGGHLRLGLAMDTAVLRAAVALDNGTTRVQLVDKFGENPTPPPEAPGGISAAEAVAARKLLVALRGELDALDTAVAPSQHASGLGGAGGEADGPLARPVPLPGHGNGDDDDSPDVDDAAASTGRSDRMDGLRALVARLEAALGRT